MFDLPRQHAELDTTWPGYPLVIRPDAVFKRAALQQFLDAREIDTRTIWSGNVTRQPMRRDRPFRIPQEGLPNTDRVMERGVLLPLSHALGPEHIALLTAAVADYLAQER